jgi:hypothetical protein
MGRYRLVVTSQAAAGMTDKYIQWCHDQHFPDLLRVPGIVAAQRFRVLPFDADGSARFLALFDIDADDPFSVLAEIQRRNGTPDMPACDYFEKGSITLQIVEIEREWP